MIDLLIAVVVLVLAFIISIRNHKKFRETNKLKPNYLFSVLALLCVISMICIMIFYFGHKGDYYIFPLAYLLNNVIRWYDIKKFGGGYPVVVS